MIKEEFTNAVNSFRSTPDRTSELWKEIERQHSDSSRHYHVMAHIENLIKELLAVKPSFKNWHVAVFAVVYHDIIYKATKTNNEEKSAELAVERLTSIAVPLEMITRCKDFILATKRHEPVDEEVDLFTDADLSILGNSTDSYELYAKQVRKEFSIYPDFLYNPGRKKVLLHFLGMQHIYKSKFFRDKYEAAARRNIKEELERLSS